MPVSRTDFPDSTLVLLGHGTTRDPNSSVPVYQHAAELRRRGCFAEVREAFWKQEPQVEAVLASLRRPQTFIVPLFISEGYFSSVVIPRALGFQEEEAGPSVRVLRRGASLWVYCHPIGTHPAMGQVLKARAAEVVNKYPFPRAPRTQDITLFIAAHGTEQNTNSRANADRQVEQLRAQNLYAQVHALFLDEPPRIPACYELAQTRNLVVVPFFMSDGLHVRQDIPVLLGESERLVQQRLQNGQPTWRNPTEKQGKLVWYANSVGTEPSLADVILARAREGAGWLESPLPALS